MEIGLKARTTLGKKVSFSLFDSLVANEAMCISIQPGIEHANMEEVIQSLVGHMDPSETDYCGARMHVRLH